MEELLPKIRGYPYGKLVAGDLFKKSQNKLSLAGNQPFPPLDESSQSLRDSSGNAFKPVPENSRLRRLPQNERPSAFGVFW